MAPDPGDGSQLKWEFLSSYPGAQTLRGVKKGDKAIAISQYPMPEGYASYWREDDNDSLRNDETTDWEKEIQAADNDGEILLIDVMLDRDFNPLDQRNKTKLKSYWGITFWEKNKVIVDVSVLFYT